MARQTEMRHRILDAAERVLRREGLGGVTTRLIAREVGCAEGTLYVHFLDRTQLLLAILDERFPPWGEHLRLLTSRVGHRTVRANLTDVTRTAMGFYDNVMPLICSLFAEPELLPPYRKALSQRQVGPNFAQVVIDDYLRAEQKGGRVDPTADAAAAATALLGGAWFRMFTKHFMGEPLPDDDERFIANLVKNAWAGLRPH